MTYSEDHKTILWWRLLSALAIFNLVLWGITATHVSADAPYVRWHILLSGIYTAVCAFRSFIPRIDLERYCIVDSPVSSMVAGRSAATIAEISFAIQIGLLMHEMGGAAGIAWVQALTIPVIIMLTIAQILCWFGLITLNHVGHAIEESLWAITFATVGVAMATCAPNLEGTWQSVAYAGTFLCSGYVLFMVTVDVPMYLKRWREGLAHGETKLGLVEGFQDALTRRIVTRDWAIWKPEVAWLTGYFSAAVWVSIALAHLPRIS